MALKVEIYEKENVRPLSPTPESSRNYKLSLFDQIAGTHYTPIFFFYNSGAGSHHHDYDELKESLSKTLSVLYPLAGRVKDGMTIECNDKGADFVRANVTNYDLSDFLQLRKVDLLKQLLPRDPYPMDFDPSQPMLGVQVNRFRCGGTAVAICLWHGVADGAALAGFVHTWAAINRGEGAPSGGGDLVADATTIFSPVVNFDFSKSTSSFAASLLMNRAKFSTKRFVFRKREIERMRDEYILPDNRRPTGVEALSAFIWAAVIRATQQANQQNLKMHMLTHVLDLRKRMNPPFPSTCLGNMIQLTAARWEANNAGVVTAQSLIGKVREAFGKVTDDYVRKMQAEGGFLKVLTAEMGKIACDVNAIKVFSISSLCSFPFHELDFGWGMPIWYIAAPFTLGDSAYFSKTTDGGIAVQIGLTPQVMSNLDKDNQFLAHVSSTQIMSSLPSRL